VEHLSRAELIANLRRYLTGAWTARQLSSWASDTELTAGVDQLEYEAAYSNRLASILFVLASPDINGEVSGKTVQSWVAEIEAWTS
jgi:hypothetical protein